MKPEQKKIAVASLSVGSNLILVLLKLAVGIFIGSVSVLSEAAHSAVDMVAALIALFAVKKASKPADKEHPFGHGKIENISGTIEAALIFIAAIWIIYEAIMRLIHPIPMRTPILGIGVMAFSALMNFGVSQLLFKVAKETDSVALEADGWHLRTDVYTTLGVMLGLGAIWLGKIVAPHMQLDWVDPLFAIVVAFLIMRAAIHLTRQSARDLLDTRLPQEEEDLIRTCLNEIKENCALRELKTRKSGADRFINIVLAVPPSMTVEQAHQITDQLEDILSKKLSSTITTIHVEPCETGECE